MEVGYLRGGIRIFSRGRREGDRQVNKRTYCSANIVSKAAERWKASTHFAFRSLEICSDCSVFRVSERDDTARRIGRTCCSESDDRRSRGRLWQENRLARSDIHVK